MRTLLLAGIATSLLLVGASASPGSPSRTAPSQDSLSVHERYTLWSMFYSRTGCVDIPRGHCAYSPARMEFASDYGQRSSVPIAYAVVKYRDYDRNGQQTGKQAAMLFVYATAIVGGSARWKYVEDSSDGSFRCGTNVLDNPNYAIDKQIRVLKRLVRCM